MFFARAADNRTVWMSTEQEGGTLFKYQALRLTVAVQSSDFAVALAEKLSAPQAQQAMQLARYVGRSKAPS